MKIMKKHLAAVLILVFGLMLATAPVFAQEKGYSSGYEIVKDASGTLKLRIHISALASGLWLGVTFYTPNGMEVENHIYPIKAGKSTTEINISSKFVNGSLEAAVWTKKLSQNECLKTDTFCQNNGYRLTGMVAYTWRYIVSP